MYWLVCVCMKLSIFCETFRKPTAQRNQIRTFPTTASLLDAATSASTSLSEIAKTGAAKSAPSRSATQSVTMKLYLFVSIPPIRVIKDWR